MLTSRAPRVGLAGEEQCMDGQATVEIEQSRLKTAELTTLRKKLLGVELWVKIKSLCGIRLNIGNVNLRYRLERKLIVQ